MKKAIKTIINNCLCLKGGESFLVLTDNTGDREEISNELLEHAKIITDRADKRVVPVAEVNGEEPGSDTAEMMKKYDVIAAVTEKSISHTNARSEACKAGARIALMPGITKDIIKNAILVDYTDMKKKTGKIADLLDAAKSARIITSLGTDLSFSLDGRTAYGRTAGIISGPGNSDNLPAGEAFIAPVEGSTEGVYMVDKSQAGVGKLTEPIKIIVKDGLAVGFESERYADKLRAMLEKIDEPSAFNIAEFGIGTNPAARICGNVLEDEKVMGTCHIALGNNAGFGGNVSVPIHVDGIISEPTIYLDDEMVMKDGKLL